MSPRETTAETIARGLSEDAQQRAGQPIKQMVACTVEGRPTGRFYRDGTEMRDWFAHFDYADGSRWTIKPTGR